MLSAWASPDGDAWRSTELPLGIRSVSALLPLGDGLALVAGERRFRPVWSFEVWTSKDGLRWHRAAKRRIPKPARFEQHRRIVQGFWSVGGGLVALETYTTVPCCGVAPGGVLRAACSGRRTLERDSSVPRSMASDGSTVIVAGTQLDLSNIVDGDPTDVPWLLVLTDAGATCDESLGWTGEEPWCLDSIAVRDGVAVIRAQSPPPEAATRFAATTAEDDSP